eukprot:6482143-Amphidinium_carterae.2
MVQSALAHAHNPNWFASFKIGVPAIPLAPLMLWSQPFPQSYRPVALSHFTCLHETWRTFREGCFAKARTIDWELNPWIILVLWRSRCQYI